MLTHVQPTSLFAMNAARPAHRWLAGLAIVLAGYAIAGRGFAYIGVHPLYVGELLLLSGLASLLLIRQWRHLLTPLPIILLVVMGAWCTWRTLPYVGTYGIAAVRDLMIVGYGAFAVIVFGYVIDEPARLRRLLDWFARFASIYLVAVPLIWVVTQFAAWLVPQWPWAPVSIIDVKGGDILVHLAGITVFGVTALRGSLKRWQLISLAMCVAMVGAYSRGGLVSFLAAYGLCILLRPKAKSVRGVASVWLCVLVLLAVSMISVKIPGKNREISATQLIENLVSVTGESDSGNLDGTKQWRLNWWSDILDYTVFGPHRWTGKGFGVNLAIDDGYGMEAEHALRSPHNGHLTMLARAGVPGLTLWLAVHATWAMAMLGRFIDSSRRGRDAWAGLFLWLGAYWLALMINGSFDVFFEGPMGGVWLWSVMGLGMAAMWIYDRDPAMLEARS